MGGDYGAPEVVPGAVKWAREHLADEVILVGDEPVVRTLAVHAPPNVRFVHGPDVVGMDEHPARALARKKRSSIRVAAELVKSGEADGVLTAGHTGAGMAAGVLILGTLPGIDRPALAVQLPGGQPFLLLDIGANPDSTAENLAQYARMGAIFAERVMGIPNPRVALLSIGEEKGKGDARISRATELIDDTDLNFIGNVEGRDLTKFVADVVVCDAILGNVVMKFFEGLSRYIFDLVSAEFHGSLRGRLAGLLFLPSKARLTAKFDAEIVGGSPLLGVNGTVLITHGSAKRRMVWYGMEATARTIREGVNARIAESLGFPGADRETASPDPVPAAEAE
jgi:glycerol-3-phosphate acyltransferase PlsX